MEFQEYQKIKGKVINKLGGCDNGRCSECPISMNNNGFNITCSSLEFSQPETAEELLKKWDKDHRKTNADKFEEVFGMTIAYALYQPEYFAIVDKDCKRVYNKRWLEKEYEKPEENK